GVLEVHRGAVRPPAPGDDPQDHLRERGQALRPDHVGGLVAVFVPLEPPVLAWSAHESSREAPSWNPISTRRSSPSSKPRGTTSKVRSAAATRSAGAARSRPSSWS